VPPSPRQSKSQFYDIFAGWGNFEVGWVIYLVVLDRLLRATTEKGRQLFFRKKVHTGQNPGYAYEG